MIYFIIGAIALLLIYIFVIYNSLIKFKNRVDEAFSTMDVYLKKRWDLIPNLVETVKEYAKHEKSTLTEVIEMRNNAYDAMTSDEKINKNQQLSKSITKLMVLGEQYPDLKADENFIKLNEQLTKIEDEIANSRKYYNGTVREYNNKVEMFPSNIVAMIFGYKIRKMFEANTDERKAVNVNL